MVNYTILNGKTTALTAVNAGGKNVPALSVRSGIALDATELAAVIALGGGVGVFKDATLTYEVKRRAGRLLKIQKVVAA